MSCCVKTCKKSKTSEGLFHFPVDEKLQKVWVDILKDNNAVDPDWVLTEDSQICISHFNNSYFIRTDSDVILTGEAYPTMFEQDDYLIEEIFEGDESEIDGMITSYVQEEEVIPNGDQGQINLDEHITTTEHVIETEVIGGPSPQKQSPAKKLRNIGPGNNSVIYKSNAENEPKNTNVSSVTVAPKQRKEVVPSGGKKPMQAIQIGKQFYLVSPNTPDEPELTTSQLSAIKEKILNEIQSKSVTPAKSKSPLVNKKPLPSPAPKNILPKPAPKAASTPLQKTKQPLTPKDGIKKNVTTIDLNKVLPSTLKNIVSSENKKKRKLDDDSETFTVSSSLDIVPVTPGKKPRDDTSVSQASKVSNFPGNLGGSGSVVPRLDLSREEVKELAVNRTQFYKLLQEVNKNMPDLNKNFWSHVYNQDTIIINKTAVSKGRPPWQFLTITIDVRLQASIYKNNSQLSYTELNDLNINLKEPISLWSQIKVIMDKLGYVKETEEFTMDFDLTDPRLFEHLIHRTVSVCKKVVEHGRLAIAGHDSKTVAFISEQLSLLTESKDFRCYSVNLMVFCYVIYLSSPTLYQYLRKVLIVPDDSVLKQLGGVEINREFVHVNDIRINSLSAKLSGFSAKEKVVALHLVNVKLGDFPAASNILMFIISSVCTGYEEIVYFCPVKDHIAVNKLLLVTEDIIKKLENIDVKVVALISEYNELSFELFKRFSSKQAEKLMAVPHPADKRRKLFLLYENLTILTAICWDWMSKEFFMYPPPSIKSPTDKSMHKASFSFVVNFLKKQKVDNFFKGINLKDLQLIDQLINKEKSSVDESQKNIFTQHIFQNKVIQGMEQAPSKEWKQTGEFMRIIHDWWTIVNSRSDSKMNNLKQKLSSAIGEKNKEPLSKLSNIAKWIHMWRTHEKKLHKLNIATFHVFGENCAGSVQLGNYLLMEYNVDRFHMGNFQIRYGRDVGSVGPSSSEICNFGFK